MAHDVEGDPFENTKMTFGEHLEELRGALFRAIVGMLAGVLLAFPVAPTVVRWIEWPLKKALRKHYLAGAKQKIEEEPFDRDASERWAGVDQFGMIPERMFVDKYLIQQQLGQIPSEQRLKQSFAYQPEDVHQERCFQLASRLCEKGTHSRNSPEKAIWQQFTATQQQAVTRLAESREVTAADRTLLAEALNTAIESPALHQDNSFTSIRSLIDGERGRLLQAMRDSLAMDFSVEASRSLNRQLIDAIFADDVRPFRPELLELTVWKPVGINVQALSVHEPFMIYIKAALIVGFILASPWVFYQVWTFVAAGLYPHERQFVYKLLPSSIGLFLMGAALAFFFVFEPVLDFLLRFNRTMGISAEPRITDWLTFVLLLPIGFGISFQLPLVMLFLERIGIMTVESYVSRWRISVLIIFVVSMFLTPADPISMLLMAIPLTALYFGGIALCKSFPKSNALPPASMHESV